MVNPDGAAVYIDDSLYGYGTMEIDSISGGKHRVKVTKYPFEEQDKKVKIYANDITNLNVILSSRNTWFVLQPDLKVEFPSFSIRGTDSLSG